MRRVWCGVVVTLLFSAVGCPAPVDPGPGVLGVFVPEDQCDPRAARDAGVARPPDEPTLNTDVRVGEMDCQGQVALPSGEVTLRLRRHGGVVERRGRASQTLEYVKNGGRCEVWWRYTLSKGPLDALEEDRLTVRLCGVNLITPYAATLQDVRVLMQTFTVGRAPAGATTVAAALVVPILGQPSQECPQDAPTVDLRDVRWEFQAILGTSMENWLRVPRDTRLQVQLELESNP